MTMGCFAYFILRCQHLAYDGQKRHVISIAVYLDRMLEF